MLSLSSLAKKDLFSSPIRVGVGIATISIGIIVSMVCILLFFLVQHVLAGQYTGTARTELSVDIYPKFSVGFLKVTKSEQIPLSYAFLETLQKHPMIQEAHAEETLTYPTVLTLSLFNTAFETDSPIYGLSDDLFRQFQQQELKDPTHIPVLISKQLIDLYNLGIAQALNKPQLNEDFLKGWSFSVDVGKSSLFYDKTSVKQQRYTAEVVGVSNAITMVGITVPISSLRTMQAAVSLTDKEYYINKIRATATSRDYIPQIQSYVESQGFETSSLSQERSASATQITGVGIAFFIGMGLILLLVCLSLFLLFWSHVHEKKELYALLRTQGAQVSTVRRLLFTQLWYLLRYGGLLGILVGGTVFVLLYSGLTTALGPTIITMSTYIFFCIESILITLGCMIFIGLITGIFPYHLAVKQTPGTLLVNS